MIKPKTRFEEFLAKIAGVAYGKNTVPKSRIEKWMEKIAQNMLPAATAADAGKAVVVGETGDYELGEADGGGNNVAYVKITTSGTSTIVFHADKTYAEIEALIASGKKVYLQYTGDPLTSFKKAYQPNGPFYAINVTGINASTNNLTLQRIEINAADNVTGKSYSISLT